MKLVRAFIKLLTGYQVYILGVRYNVRQITKIHQCLIIRLQKYFLLIGC